jgi:hypothetical protein
MATSDGETDDKDSFERVVEELARMVVEGEVERDEFERLVGDSSLDRRVWESDGNYYGHLRPG